MLVEAIASGKPVVATRLPHAEELLGQGSGLLVPHQDAGAIADALRTLLADRRRTAEVAAVAHRQAPLLFWEAVGESYVQLALDVLEAERAELAPAALPRPSFRHLVRMSDHLGVFEHALFARPRSEHGYCTDDVARALVAIMREPRRSSELERLADTCLDFVARAQIRDGRFRNRLSLAGHWLRRGR